MPEIGEGYKRYKKADKGLFAEDSNERKLLDKGFELVISDDGLIVDIWDPTSHTTRDLMGDVVGPREKPFDLPVKKDITKMTIDELWKYWKLKRLDWEMEGKARKRILNNLAAKKQSMTEVAALIIKIEPDYQTRRKPRDR